MSSHAAGTIFVLRSPGQLGWSIRLLTRSRVNHAGICVGDNRTVEAQRNGAVARVEHSLGRDVMFGLDLYERIEGQAPGRCQRIAEEALKLRGTPYNFGTLVALAWVSARHDPSKPAAVPEKPNWLERKVMNDNELICSQLADLACMRARVHLFDDGRLPGSVTPGDIEMVMANPDWEIKVDLL